MLSSWNPLDWLAQFLSVRLGGDLPSLRFFLTICFGYPISVVYLLFVIKKPARTAHIYFITTGVLLLFWNYGIDIVHLLVGIVSTLILLRVCGPTDLAVALTFIFNMTYLLMGYYYMNYGTYDINWTMSYCILCLRLIGLSWDYRDGSLPVESLSEYQRNSAFKALPSALEIFSFCFMPTACFAGPQFTWRHYYSFINQTLRPQIILRNRSLMQKYFLNPKLHRTLSRLLSGVVCLIIHVISLTYCPMDYMLTQEFLTERSFLYRICYMCVYSRCLIMRYLAIWLIGEGACVLLGLGCTGRFRIVYHGTNKSHFNDVDNCKASTGEYPTSSLKSKAVERTSFRKAAVLSSNATGGFCLAEDLDDLQVVETAVREGRATIEEAQHTRCANVSIVRFESATNTDLLVSSFNINTNKWMLEYLYKRLRFLGNKTLSQVLTLTFLAIWHGFYSGYYVNFFLEFITIFAEKQFLTIVHRSIYADFLYETLPGKVITTIIGKLHIFFVLSSPLVAFSLLRASLWIPVYNSVYWIGFIYLLWPLAALLAKKIFPPKPHTGVAKLSS